ncbi:MAG: molybdate ABC transporter substrate-binding protein, partial [Candidatus Bathyanammoxibius sp.]
MREKLLVASVLLLITSLPVMAHGKTVTNGGDEILVFVAASLTDAMNEIKARFEERTGARVFMSFGSSGTLYRQIVNGAPADVFISASDTQVDALELEGLALPDTRREILTNGLVIITHMDNTLEIKRPEDLTRQGVGRIAIGEPGSVPAGSYAKEALVNLGLWDALHAKIVPALDVRAVLAYVERKAAGAGIVYSTDATISERVRVVYEFPEDSHTKIIYPAVIMKETRSEGLA